MRTHVLLDLLKVRSLEIMGIERVGSGAAGLMGDGFNRVRNLCV